MSALRSLALITLLVAETRLHDSALYAQTSTARGGSTKGKAYVPPKKAPVRKAPPPPPGTKSPSDFSVPIPEEDSWYAWETAPSVQTTLHQVGLLGVVNYFGSGGGLEYSYLYSPQLSLGGTLLHTQASLKDDATAGATEFINAQSNSLRVFGRYAFYSWFYTAGGLNMTRIAGEYGWKGSAIANQKIKTDFSANLVALDLCVGSEWKGPWGTYFGVDWLGAAVPLAGSIDYDDQADIEVTSKILKGKTLDERLDQETSAQLGVYYLNLRLGLNF